MATEAPTAPATEAALPPPSGISSTEVFRQQRAAEGLDQPPSNDAEHQPPPPPAAPDKPADEPPPAPKKGSVPSDVIDPDRTNTPTVHDEVKDLLSAELPKGSKKEQIDSFGKLKTRAAEKLQAALDRAAELEQKISQGDTSKTELEQLRTQLKEANERASKIGEDFEKVAFEKSPRFQAQFSAREQTAIDLAKSYLDGTEIKPDIIELAARATGRKRVEILRDAGVDETALGLISPHLAAFDTVQREKQAALADWKNLSKQEREQAQQQQERAQAQRAEQENKVWESVVNKARTDLLPLRASKENTEWNSRSEELVTRAKQIFNGDGADLPTFGETILKGVAYDAQQEVVEHLRGEVASLRAENGRLKSAAPGATMTSGSQDNGNANAPKASRDEQAKSTFNQQLGLARAG